jgi:hypothetical protein
MILQQGMPVDAELPAAPEEKPQFYDLSPENIIDDKEEVNSNDQQRLMPPLRQSA